MIQKSINWVKKKLKKLFSYLLGETKAPKYIEPIIDAANNKGYVESYSNKADSLHLDIKKKIYEEDLQESFLKSMNKLAKHFRKDRVRLAVDFQEEGFYGKTSKPHIIGTSYKGKSYPKAFKFITISILTGNKEERIPLYALSWHIGQDVVDSIAILLSTVQHWFSKIEIIQFDRGFHNKALIKFLEDNKAPYLIHIKKTGKYLKGLVKATKSFYRGKYRFKVNIDKSTFVVETNLFVCKKIEKKDWLFASSVWFKNKWQVRNYYKNRWQIETNYAVHNSARLMSKSTDYMIRYFYYLTDVLLQVLWRLCASKIPFRTFLFSMVVGPEKMLKKKPNFAGT
jgi:hypothetical protein